MAVSSWQKTWVRVITTALTLAVMTMIFFFSMEDAEKSDQTSGRISDQVISVLHPGFQKYQPVKRQSIRDQVQHYVRKIAHFSEYTLLGIMLRFFLESWMGHLIKSPFRLSAAAFVLGVLYAVSDELHQLAIDGRSGQMTDVAVDSLGVLTGIILCLLLIRMINSRLMKKGSISYHADEYSAPES